MHSIPHYPDLIFDHYSRQALNRVDVMKPNISELLVMIERCLQDNLIVRNKAVITNIIKQYNINKSNHRIGTIVCIYDRVIALT